MHNCLLGNANRLKANKQSFIMRENKVFGLDSTPLFRWAVCQDLHPRLVALLREGSTGKTASARHLLHGDRKSTRLNSSHTVISYAVFCLKKKKKKKHKHRL